MSLERLVICTCGHTIDSHSSRGCAHTQRGSTCSCVFNREGVVETLLGLEREAIRRQWTRDEASPA